MQFAAHALAPEDLGPRDAVGVEHERAAAGDGRGDPAQRVGLIGGAAEFGGGEDVDRLRLVAVWM